MDHLIAFGAPIDGFNVQKKCSNLYWLQTHQQHKMLASIFFTHGEMSKGKTKTVPLLSLLCFRALEPEDKNKISGDAYHNFWMSKAQFYAENKTVHEFIRKLLSILKNLQEGKQHDFIKTVFVPAYIKAEAAYEYDGRFACYFGLEEWKKKNTEEKESIMQYCRIKARRQQYLNTRIFSVIDRQLIKNKLILGSFQISPEQGGNNSLL